MNAYRARTARAGITLWARRPVPPTPPLRSLARPRARTRRYSPPARASQAIRVQGGRSRAQGSRRPRETRARSPPRRMAQGAHARVRSPGRRTRARRTRRAGVEWTRIRAREASLEGRRGAGLARTCAGAGWGRKARARGGAEERSRFGAFEREMRGGRKSGRGLGLVDGRVG